MFTGLVQAVGVVQRIEPDRAGVAITLHAPGWTAGPGAGSARGASVSVAGCCLTLTGDPEADHISFVAVPETLEKTTLSRLTAGSRVNLEPAVTASTLMGGHIVQGHVDGVGRVVSVLTDGQWRVRIEPPPGLMRFMAPKGSVCIEGVSLTIADLHPGDRTGAGGWIDLALIPETLERTTLADLASGDAVNIEADILAKTVVHHLAHYAAAYPAQTPA